MPDGGLTDGEAYLLDKDKEDAGPDCGAVNFARGPEIVSHQNEKKAVGEQRRYQRFSVDHREGPARDGGDHDADGGDEDDAFVRGRIETSAERGKDKHGEDEHVGHGDYVEGLHIEARWRVGPGESFGGRQDAKNDHKAGEEETGNAEAAVNIHAACGNKRSLRDEQEDPHGKDGAVDVNDPAG